MPSNDLMPQMRTRLNHVERWAGVFVLLAVLIALGGLGQYVYTTAVNKGWKRKKVPYFTLVSSADGLKVGSEVKLMGFKAGTITDILPNAPGDYYNVTVRVEIGEPYYGYLWTDSTVELKASLLGGKSLVVTKGGSSGDLNVSATYMEKNGDFFQWVPASGDKKAHWAVKPTEREDMGYLIMCQENADVVNSANTLVTKISDELPGLLSLTNQVADLLEASTVLLRHASDAMAELKPVVANVQTISTMLTNENGSLGQWVIPTEMNSEITETIAASKGTVKTAETNLVVLSQSLNESLQNISDITANLRQQVEVNSFMLSSISEMILNLDDFVAGLKRNWLLKGSFEQVPVSTNDVPKAIHTPSIGF